MKRISAILALATVPAFAAGAWHRFTATLHYDGTPAADVPTALRISPALLPGFDYDDTDGTDFEIRDGNGALLPYEIDTWNPVGESLLWVKVPSFADGAELSVVYGGTSEDMTRNATNVWSAYAGVWHMNEADARDSTANGFHGMASNGVARAASGRVGNALSFAGTRKGGVYCGDVLPNPRLLENGCTVSAWVRPSAYNPPDHPEGLDGYALFGKKYCLSVRIDSDSRFTVTTPGGQDNKVNDLTLPGTGTWFHVATTFKTNATAGCKLYLNGAFADSANTGSKPPKDPAGTTAMFLGRNQWNDQEWRGDLDEVRLMPTIAAPAYLAAEHAAMARADLLSYGALESEPVVPGDTFHRFTARVSYAGAPAADVPVLLKLSTAIPGFDYADFINAGRDLEIRDGNGDTLPFEIDTWDTDGTSLVWVKMPRFADDETLEVTYGRSTADGTADAAAVWSRYVGVWHFNGLRYVPGAPYGGFPNSTAVPGIDGQKAELSIAGEPGAIGASVRIAKDEAAYKAYNRKNKLRVCRGGVFVPDSGENGPLDLGDSFTISGWFNHGTDLYVYDKLFFKREFRDNSGDATGSFAVEMKNEVSSSDTVHADGSGNDASSLFALGVVPDGRWGHASFAYDGAACSVRTNGISGQVLPVTPVVDNDLPLCFGNNIDGVGAGVGENAWIGWMDEVRLMDGTPSDAWAAAEYAAMAFDVLSCGAVSEVARDASMPTLAGAPSFGWSDAAGAFVFTATVEGGTAGRVLAVYTDLDTGVATTNVLRVLDGTETFPLVLADAPTLQANRMFRYAAVAANAAGTQSVRASGLAPVHTGRLSVECLQDADEAWLSVPASNGVFRISRAKGRRDSVANPLEVSFALSGTAIDLRTVRVPNPLKATIPAGGSWVDVPIAPVFNADVTTDTALVLAVAGTNVRSPSSATASMRVKSFSANPLERWISPSGDDEASGTSPATPMRSPAAALAAIHGANPTAASPGTIHAAPGRYPVDGMLTVDAPIRILGGGAMPSDVVFSNTLDAVSNEDASRIVKLDNAGALVANLTLENGLITGWNSIHGSAFWIHANGGTVSNCVVRRCRAGHKVAAAGWLFGPGVVTHTVFRDLQQPDGIQGEPSRCNMPVAVLAQSDATGAPRVENCLFTDIENAYPYSIVKLTGYATMRNCTFAKIVLGPAGPTVTKLRDDGEIATNTPFASPLYVEGRNARVANVVMVDVRDEAGRVLAPLFRNPAAVTNGFENCVMDACPRVASETETAPAPEVPESCTVVAPSSVPSLFRAWKRGDFTPEKDGALFNTGANWDGMPAVDLAGQRRLRGPAVDIGAFEWAPPDATVMLLR